MFKADNFGLRSVARTEAHRADRKLLFSAK